MDQQQRPNLSQQKQKQRPLPFELHCQICEFLPIEKNANFLQLSNKLNQLCLAKVRRQHQLWKQFRNKNLNLMFDRFHQGIKSRIQAIELQCNNDDINNNEHFPRFESRINEEMAYDASKMAQLSGQNAVEKALSFETREKAVEHFWNCWMELFNILRSSEWRCKRICNQIDGRFRREIENIKLNCRPHPFPRPRRCKKHSKVIQTRFRKEYELALAKLETKIDEIEKARAERLLKAPWMRIFFDWDEKVRKNMKMVIKYWKIAKAQENMIELEKLLITEEKEAMEIGNKNQCEPYIHNEGVM